MQQELTVLCFQRLIWPSSTSQILVICWVNFCHSNPIFKELWFTEGHAGSFDHILYRGQNKSLCFVPTAHHLQKIIPRCILARRCSVMSFQFVHVDAIFLLKLLPLDDMLVQTLDSHHCIMTEIVTLWEPAFGMLIIFDQKSRFWAKLIGSKICPRF